MKLAERFKTNRLLIESGSKKYDAIYIDEFNLKSEWITGFSEACNEFVYDDEGLTWAKVEKIQLNTWGYQLGIVSPDHLPFKLKLKLNLNIKLELSWTSAFNL